MVRLRKSNFGLALLAVLALQLGSAAVTVVEAATGTGGDWAMLYADPAHDSVNHAATTLNPATARALHVTHVYTGWRIMGAPRRMPEFPPPIAGNLAYSVAGGRAADDLRAFQIPGGQKVWDVPCPGCSFGPPVISGGVVYIEYAGGVETFSASTGQLVWQSALAGNPAFDRPVTVSGGIVYAPSDLTTGSSPTQMVYAFDATTGAVVWSSPDDFRCCQYGPITVADGLAYLTFSSAYFSSGGDFLLAYDAFTGAIVFTTRVPGAFGPGVPAFSNGMVYVPDGCQLNAFDAQTGALRWSAAAGPVPATWGQCDSSVTPVSETGILLAAQGPNLIAFSSATGQPIWTVAGSFSQASVANGVIYVSDDASLQGIDEATGSTLYSSGIICSNPSVAHNAVYAWCLPSGTYGSSMTAFGI